MEISSRFAAQNADKGAAKSPVCHACPANAAATDAPAAAHTKTTPRAPDSRPDSRLDFIDALRGFGILAVMLGHTTSPFFGFIYLWHMPLFFIVGGGL